MPEFPLLPELDPPLELEEEPAEFPPGLFAVTALESSLGLAPPHPATKITTETRVEVTSAKRKKFFLKMLIVSTGEWLCFNPADWNGCIHRGPSFFEAVVSFADPLGTRRVSRKNHETRRQGRIRPVCAEPGLLAPAAKQRGTVNAVSSPDTHRRLALRGSAQGRHSASQRKQNDFQLPLWLLQRFYTSEFGTQEEAEKNRPSAVIFLVPINDVEL